MSPERAPVIAQSMATVVEAATVKDDAMREQDLVKTPETSVPVVPLGATRIPCWKM
jgi:hypothetical protein